MIDALIIALAVYLAITTALALVGCVTESRRFESVGAAEGLAEIIVIASLWPVTLARSLRGGRP